MGVDLEFPVGLVATFKKNLSAQGPGPSGNWVLFGVGLMATDGYRRA